MTVKGQRTRAARKSSAAHREDMAGTRRAFRPRGAEPTSSPELRENVPLIWFHTMGYVTAVRQAETPETFRHSRAKHNAQQSLRGSERKFKRRKLEKKMELSENENLINRNLQDTAKPVLESIFISLNKHITNRKIFKLII